MSNADRWVNAAVLIIAIFGAPEVRVEISNLGGTKESVAEGV